MKKLLIIGGSILTAGIMLLLIILGTSSNVVKGVFAHTKETTTLDSVAELNIDIIGNTTNYFLERYDGTSIKIDYVSSEKTSYDIELKDGLLSIKETNYEFTIHSIFPTFYQRKVTVYLPRGVNVNKIDASLTTGNLDIDEINAQEIIVEATTGNVHLDELSANEIRIEQSTGNTKMEDVVANSFYHKSSTGNTNMDEVVINNDIKCVSSTGNITFEDLTAKSIHFEASTGNVKGNLMNKISDYSIESKTSTGKNSLPNNAEIGPNKMFVKTSTGNIVITFAK